MAQRPKGDVVSRYEPLPDRDLAIAFKDGDEGAYEAIFARHAERVERVCRRILQQPDDAAEAAQDTFLRVYKALPSFNGRYHLGAWITRIATNICLDRMRARSRRPLDLGLVEELENVRSLAPEESDPQHLYLKKTEGWRVRRILRSLSPMHRAAIVLRDFEGLSYAEVAIALGITEAQTKALIHRARRSFKRRWTRTLASVFLPARWIEKMRAADGAIREQASHLTSSSGSVATSCNTAFQQCGQYMVERVGGFVGSVAIGAAAASTAVAATVAPTPVPSPPPEMRHERAVSREVEDPKPRQTAKARKKGSATATASPSAAPTPSPQAQPSPTPSASPSPQSSSSSSEPQKTPTESPPPSSPPVVRFGSASSGAPSGQAVNELSASCWRGIVNQRLDTVVTHEDRGFPGRVELAGSGNAFDLTLTIADDEGDILYRASGSQLHSQQGRTTSFTFSGRYQTRNMEARDRLGLPLSGSLEGRLVVDCPTTSVVTEELVFATE